MSHRRYVFTVVLFFAATLSAACVGSTPDDPGGGGADGAPNGVDAAPGAGIDADPGAPDASGGGARPGDGVQWLAFPSQQSLSDSSWGTALTDIANHLPSSYGNTYYDSDKVTHGHETTHGINSHLRNYFNDTGETANGFYVLNDRGALVVEPDIRKSEVAQYVPAALRGSRFSLYVTGSTSWDDRPLYLFDEWVAYTNGGEVGTNLVDEGKWSYGWRDAVMGQLEFTVYAVATAIAVAQGDPSYFASNTQFREFLAWNIERAMRIFRKGAAMASFEWDSQDDYYQTLQTGAAGEPIRAFVRDTYGVSWTNEVLGL